MLVLILEDDPDYADIMAELLRRESFNVIVAGSIHGAQRVCETQVPDMAIVDVMLPEGSGLQVVEELRRHHATLPIMLVTNLGSASDVVRGFEAGADDYLVKPFHPQELLMRVRALARRSQRAGPSREEWCASNGRAPDIPPAGLVLAEDERAVYVNGVKVDVTALEYDILRELAMVPGQVLSHAYLNERVWHYRNLPDSTLLKGHVSSLRQKLKDAGGDPWVIRTVRRVGYAYHPD